MSTMNTNQLLDAVKDRFNIPSDYALAPKIGVTRAMVSRYRNRAESLSDDKAMLVADLLELDPGYVLNCMNAERAKTEAAKAAWERAAERLAALARREAKDDCILC